MQKTLREIAKIVEGEVVGDAELLISGASGIREAAQEIVRMAPDRVLDLTGKTSLQELL